jgi:hypothetical protein
VDLGCAADAVGNVWYACLQWLGANRTEQVAALWTRLQAFYEANEVGPRLDSLTLLLIKQRGQPPKLRTKAARVRAAVPFTAALAAEFADRSETMATIAHLAGHLARVYECLDAAVGRVASSGSSNGGPSIRFVIRHIGTTSCGSSVAYKAKAAFICGAYRVRRTT